jgi:hypothetical protein
MLLLKYLLLSLGVAMFVIAAGILTYDLTCSSPGGADDCIEMQNQAPGPAPATRWRTSVALVMLAWAPLLISAGIV